MLADGLSIACYLYIYSMKWLTDFFNNPVSAAYIILIYAIVIAAGVALGKVSFKGVKFGIAFVLFTGIAMGYWGFAIDEHVLDFIKEFGLILFVYTMGLQVGPGFFASLRNQGLRLNMLALICVLLSVATVVVMFYVTDIPMPSLVGLMSGAVTNTPGLGAAQQTIKDLSALHPELNQLPPLGTNYALAYPGGVIGIIFVLILGKWMLKINMDKEKEAHLLKSKLDTPQPATLTLQVKNPSLVGKKVKAIFDTLQMKFVVSRIYHNKKTKPATKETVLHEDDIILIVANPADFDRLRTLIGVDSEMDLSLTPGSITAKKIRVTQKEVCNKALSGLDVIHQYSVTITRVLRSGIEFIPYGHTHLQFGDVVTVIGDEQHINTVAKVFGNSEKRLKEPNVAGLFIGIALGVLLGIIPWSLPGIPVPVKLGLAGGPLIVAIIISRYGSVVPITSYVTQSANYMVREIGIVLFLSSVGLKAGPTFVATIMSMQGLVLVLLAACITIIPLLITMLIGRLMYKMNMLEIFGLLAGASTDPPALSFAIQSSGTDAPAVAYAGVYPLTMFLRIMAAQLLVLLFV
jgi:putative transport protein